MKSWSAILLIAFCLIPNTSPGAELSGDETGSRKLKSAEKVIAFLSTAGIYDERIKKIAYFFDERIDDGSFRIGAVKYQGFKMQLQYEADSVRVENFQIRFTHEDLPSWQLQGTPEELMVRYKFEF